MERIKNVLKLSELSKTCEAAQTKLRHVFRFAVSTDKVGYCIIAAFLYQEEAVEYMCRTERNINWYLICLEE